MYIIQAEERDLPYELLQDLAEVIAESPDLVHADAMRQVRSAHGIFSFEDKEEASRISERFTSLGFANFLLEKLLDVPAPEPLLASDGPTDPVEIAAVARVDTRTERTVTTINPFRMRIAYPRIPIPGSAIEEKKVEEHSTDYYLDLLTRGRHWRAHESSLAVLQGLLSKTAIPATSLTLSARRLVAGDRNLPRFEGERDYDRYLTWLYQLGYAER